MPVRDERKSPGLLANASPAVLALANASGYVVPDVYWLLRRHTLGFASVLDVGCGAETSPFRFVRIPPGQVRTGIDRFAPSVERSRAVGIHNDYLVRDIFAADFGARFDCVTALDVVEHFEKAAGYAFIERLEELARHRVVVLTPNGYVPQEPFDGNEFQRHRSGWSVQDLEALGYRVRGAMGWKPLRGEYALPKLRPAVAGTALAMLTQYATLRLPRFAYHLFAVKDLSRR